MAILPLVHSDIDQLALLASQHHASEYNRLKFGPQGSTNRYTPLSVLSPDHFKELQLHQAQRTQGQAWWLCRKTDPLDPLLVLGPCGVQPPDNSILQHELSAAIEEPLDNYFQVGTRPPIKTSLTHPINISYVVPPELIPLISSHLLLSPPTCSSPTVFEIPPSFTLDRLTLSHQRHRPAPSIPESSGTSHLRTRSGVTKALQAAINSGLAAADSPNNDRIATPVPSKIFHSNTSSLSLSLSLMIASTSVFGSSIPELGLEPPCSAPPILAELPKTFAPGVPTIFPLSVESVSEIEEDGSGSETPNEAVWGIPGSGDRFESTLNPAPGIVPQRQHSTSPTPTPFILGNLFLSSCPGKKVRLQGPVKGRGGVCRDLDTDLRRMKDLGIGCIVCCLDDPELDFLGAPWPEYERSARNAEIDVLRIPIPEGLPPLTPSSLDTHLSEIIKTYTLRGIPVLIHCRGGVGRAGVIACCWIVKLGLCGWVSNGNRERVDLSQLSVNTASDLDLKTHGASDEPGGLYSPSLDIGVGLVRKDTVQLVERVIKVLRKRRSMKAIETYEQVKFLADFVEYLRCGNPPLGGEAGLGTGL